MPNGRNSFNQDNQSLNCDIFLSHRSVDKDFVHKLAADIEAETSKGRNLLTWVDDAEIRAGQSIPAMINQGLENCRFIGIVMTPQYFQSESGWTDAEWHAALHVDPDNRRARIIPLLAKDCPYIPFLLRHLKAIDFRGNRYSQALQELLSVLKGEPLPRPITYRGQLITPGGKISRETLVAERAVPDADPDAISERLYCNLLPVLHLPKYVYSAPIAKGLRREKADGSESLPSKQQIKDAIRLAQEEAKVVHPFMPVFRVFEDKIITFHDLESLDGPFASVIDDEEIDEPIPINEFLVDEDGRNIIVSLLNMAIDRHAMRVGLFVDETKQRRFFFRPKNGEANIITWTAVKKKANRTVAKPCIKNGEVLFWRHQGAYLKMLFLANKFYLQIKPTWVITEDGFRVKKGPKVGRLIIKWTGPERNLQLLYHIRFWTSIMRTGRGPISVRAGDQTIEFETSPAFIQQAYGIAHDQKDLMLLLDQEAPLIALREEELADQAAEAELAQFDQLDEDEELTEDDSDEEDTSKELE